MIKNVLATTVIMFAIYSSQVKAEECNYWHSEVDQDIDVEIEIDKSDPKNVLKGIDCLLKLQGERKEGLFSGATNSNVSQIFPPASVEVCALYYISYLYYQNWKHADAVALVGKDGSLNSDGSVKKAFESYRRWRKKLDKIGLQKAREIKLDPLATSGVRWY